MYVADAYASHVYRVLYGVCLFVYVCVCIIFEIGDDNMGRKKRRERAVWEGVYRYDLKRHITRKNEAERSTQQQQKVEPERN